MINLVSAVIMAAAAYLIGSVNFSIILSKLITGKDIRESGSGNAGATNMLRTYGKKMGALTLLLDVLKGVVTVWLVKKFSDSLTLAYFAGLFVILGHNFPIYFGFKGGKGVATSLGVVLVLDWKVGLIAAVIAISIMALTRYVSLGSICGGVLFIIIEFVKALITGDVSAVRLICTVLIGGLLIVRHHANIKRLLNGTENKLGAAKG